MLASIRAFFWRIVHLKRRTKSEAALGGELEFHLQMEIEQNLRQGMAHEEARRQALISLGGLEQTKEACRETCAVRWAVEFGQDLSYGWRMMRKSPRFTAIAVLTLALGIGANSAIFSAVNGILLVPLPYADSSRLVTVQRNVITYYITFAELREIQQQCTTLESIMIYSTGMRLLTGGKVPKQVEAAYVPSVFFPLLGVKPLLGRPILPEDTQPGNDRVAVLTYGLWMDTFGGDMGIVGHDISVDHKPYTVIGVMAREFGAGIGGYYWVGSNDGSGEDMWLPQVPPPPGALNRRAGPLVIARLKKDATLAQVNAQLQPLSARFAASYSAVVAKRAGPEGLNLFAQNFDLGINPQVQTGLLIILGAVGFVLLMACVNVTSLLVARSWTRQRELAIRTALGATRLRILRQFLAESLLLALAGGAVGLFFSIWGIDLLRMLAPPYTPRVDLIRLDGNVLWFTMGISLLVAVLVGLAPALQASSRRAGAALKGGLGGSFAAISMRPSHRLRSALVVLEVLLAVIVVVGGALMGRSFYKLMNVSTGISESHILTMRVNLSGLFDNEEDLATKDTMVAEDVLAGIRPLSGVQQAALSSYNPLNGGLILIPGPRGQTGLYVEGLQGNQFSADQEICVRSVTPGYFAALGIRLLAGRDFEPRDRTSPVAIVSESFARKYIPGDPLGKRFSADAAKDGRRSWMEIVGVVNDVRDHAVKELVGPVYYKPIRAYNQKFQIIARTSANPMSLVPAIARVVRSVAQDAPIENIQTVDQIIADSAAEPKFYTALVGSFGVLGLLLAIIGVYGVISYSVVQKTHEIGVRMALGAQRRDVLCMVLKEGMRLAVAGIAFGMGGAVALTRVLRSMLFGIEPTDLATFVGVAVFLALAALAACYIPARRAVKLDPMVALRHE
ncbi:MAG: ABC transporter permease [Acidobacteriia bacterium]|nr:ABC transporter permease [Terriglobia bacterium]